ncbi:SDR family oxidoreductase [Thioalkalivibrio sp. XN279]|uniref:SDR family oxidoreductase n=1 Tax=Thioalkalivibrio sp. XN279 TaxID=2714953 RepID=UPI00140C1B86|nr:SDR family oxidoreductase [Thioalkalivibrio sp. XN279]NHA16001.1 SDR family oxidoreductase [Thioalkalivibrio sp. XN279]
MQLKGARIVLTGASGGLGQALGERLAAKGATLLLTGRNLERLEAVTVQAGPGHRCMQADISTPDGITAVAGAARDFGANILVNNAGIGGFGLLQDQGAAGVEQILAINLVAPIQLTRAMLPGLLAQPEGAVVNIGSAFGSIPFAGFAAYSAAKAGLHSFSEALRRELADTGVHVLHVSPRAIETPLNAPAVVALNAQLGNASDSADRVAAEVVRLLEHDARRAVLGWPERFFAWLHGVAPGLVDRGLRRKLPAIKRHAAAAPSITEH